MRTTPQEDVVIVGGGPAGSACACVLASKGLSPLVLERESEPRHKICGEFISIEAQGILAALGVDLQSLGGALIGTVRLVFEHEIVEDNASIRGHRVDPARAGRGTLEASRSERRQGPTRSCGRWNRSE